MLKVHQKKDVLVGGRTLKDELIGCAIVVVESGVSSLVHLQGIVVDETRESLSIQTNNGIKIILKHDVVLRFKEGSLVSGLSLIGRSSERLKY